MKNNKQIIATFDAAFKGMNERKESFVIVQIFPHDTIQLLSGGLHGTATIRLDLLIQNQLPYIRLMYNSGSELLAFLTNEEKKEAINALKINKCMPTKEILLEARSLMNTPGIAEFLGCGCE